MIVCIHYQPGTGPVAYDFSDVYHWDIVRGENGAHTVGNPGAAREIPDTGEYDCKQRRMAFLRKLHKFVKLTFVPTPHLSVAVPVVSFPVKRSATGTNSNGPPVNEIGEVRTID